jgi:hypothetical protein
LKALSDVMYAQDGLNSQRFYLGPVKEFVRGDRLLFFIPGQPFPISVVSPMARRITSGDPMTSLATDRLRELNRVQAAARAVTQQKIPRPPNAYILYRKDNHLTIKRAHPGVTNNEICEYIHRCLRPLLTVR